MNTQYVAHMAYVKLDIVKRNAISGDTQIILCEYIAHYMTVHSSLDMRGVTTFACAFLSNKVLKKF